MIENIGIRKILGWNHGLNNSLELTERDNTPITIQFIEYRSSEFNSHYELIIPIEND